MLQENEQHLVFVYGSLKRGYGNHGLLMDSEYLDGGVTVDSNFYLHSLGSFPAVLPGGSYSIDGEVYRVNPETLTKLDHLESNGSLYQREEVKILLHNGDEVTAWMYVFMLNDRENAVWYEKAKRRVDDSRVCNFAVNDLNVQTWLPTTFFSARNF